ncbi:tannase/feruloyl esterase family alpha/beta hydrolase [Streptomyces seoulensis]
MRRLLTVLAAALPLAAAVCLPAGASAQTGPGPHGGAPFRCSPVSVRGPAGTSVESVTARSLPGGTVHVDITPTGPVDVPDVPAYCEVVLTLTHPGAGDHEKVTVWLPRTGWTGRLQTVGGSAYAAGDYGQNLADAIKHGYAAATTDAGVGGYTDTGWALDAQGDVDKPLLEDFASRAEHDTAVMSKQVVAGVYGAPADYSYFNGCSTGGRQGYMEAQRHPDDYDGILADAPAINWDEFEVATLWPQVVMNNEHTFPSQCEFNAFTAAAVKTCDMLDGNPDGLIGDPRDCHYDPRRLVGTTIDCEGTPITVTAADAAVVRKIWDGPRTASGRQLWAGLPIGASFELAGTRTADDGTVIGNPFPVPAQWIADFVLKQPSYDLTTITYDRFAQLFRQSEAEYDAVIGTDAPDLTAFRASGGKLLSWQGQADQYIPAQGTVDYREKVDRLMGGTRSVDDFYRLFLAPGVSHCAGTPAPGPAPTDALGALTDWVEHGKAPRTLSAAATLPSGLTVTRDLCRYPEVSRWNGHGDPASAAGYRCVAPSRY